MNKLFETVLSLVFPPRCSACKEILPYYSDVVLCGSCAEKWESEINSYCNICYRKVSECTCIHDNCKRTIKKLVSVSAYTSGDSVTDALVLAAKDVKDKKLFEFMSGEMVRVAYGTLEATEDMIVTFVPRSRTRKSEVGHDQSEILARMVAREFGTDSVSLLKKKGSRQQKKLHVAEREDNAKRSYVIKDGAQEHLKDKTVLIIDDVVTTGASLSACADILRQAGAREIYALTFAKTVKRK